VVLCCRPGRIGGPGDSGSWVRVEVRDSGPGLDPQDLAVAFEPGLLTERYRGSRPVGTGVGLALVGELVRRLGGRAEALPAAEGGACFAVTLPPAPRSAGPPAEPRTVP
jgi:two-component system OmpR family sensor kinase